MPLALARGLIAVGILLVAAGAAACAPTSPDRRPLRGDHEIAPARLRSAIERTLAAGTARVEIAYRIPGVARPVRFAGLTALDGSRSRIEVDMRDFGFPIEGETDAVLVVVEGEVWVRPPPAIMPLPDGIAWVRLPVGAAGSFEVLAELDLGGALRDGDAVELDHSGRITTLRHVRRADDGRPIRTTITLSDFGVPLRVAAPAPVQTIAAEDLDGGSQR